MINNTTQEFQKIFIGAQNRYGLLTYWDEKTGQKDATEIKQPIPIEKHFNGEKYLGLSPVNEQTHMVTWLGVDIDIPLKPNKFCSELFQKVGTEYFPFMTLNKRWRVIEFLDDPIHVKEANDRAKQLEKLISVELNIKLDEKSTCPTLPDENDSRSVGRWLFLPYGKDHDVCYSPDGRPLSKQQFLFRYKYRQHKLVSTCAGALSGANGGGRNKAMWCVELYRNLFDCDVTLEELNEVFDEKITDYKKLHSYIKGVEKSVAKDKYDKQYFLNGQSGWIKDICGVRPATDQTTFKQIAATILDGHYYVQSRTDFYELETNQFLTKEQIDDWWRHEEKKGMSKLLLQHPDLTRVRGYLTHAGFDAGLIELDRNEIKGVAPGKYLNIYVDPDVVAKAGDCSRLNEYYSWLFGEDNWHIIKQCLAFMLRAKEEVKHNGIKIQWFIIIHASIQGVGKKIFAQLCQNLFGYKNVRPNVKFKQMVGGHSTIIEGAQLIFLNEVILEHSTAKTKELSNEFKDLITEDNLVINPKNKPQIEIPNLCNFFVFSNSDTPLYIDDDDRRAFVVNIHRNKQEVKAMLENEGYKTDLLNAIKDPSAFKHHLLNEVTYDREMFFRDAPFTQDKADLIESNKSDFKVYMDECFDNMEFPFNAGHEMKDNFTSAMKYCWNYHGMMNKLDLFKMLKKAEDFKDLYFTMADVERYLKDKCTKWPNGEYTMQIVLPSGKRPRVYLMHLMEQPQFDHKLQPDLTDGQLGKIYKSPFDNNN